jgi:hypothetical protein
MTNIRKHRAMSNTIAAETIGHETCRFIPQPLHQPLEETLGSRAISPLLHQNVQDNAMLVDRAPQIMQNTADANEHLVQVPRIQGAPAPVQPSGEVAAEFRAPEPNALVAHDDAAFGENQLDVAQAKAEHVIQPNRLADDLRRKEVAGCDVMPSASPNAGPSASRD